MVTTRPNFRYMHWAIFQHLLEVVVWLAKGNIEISILASILPTLGFTSSTRTILSSLYASCVFRDI